MFTNGIKHYKLIFLLKVTKRTKIRKRYIHRYIHLMTCEVTLSELMNPIFVRLVLLRKLGMLAELKYPPTLMKPDTYTIVVLRRKKSRKEGKHQKKGYVKLGVLKITKHGLIADTEGRLLEPLDTMIKAYEGTPLAVIVREMKLKQYMKYKEQIDIQRKYERYKKRLSENIELYKTLYSE